MKKYSGGKKKSRKKEQEKRRQKLGMMKSGFAPGVRRKNGDLSWIRRGLRGG
jgi:hypothetical protein